MTKENQVTIKMNVRSAAAVRQILFEHQKNYTTGFAVPERIFEIREVITDLDDAIQQAIEKEE
jgi:hypothetical protein